MFCKHCGQQIPDNVAFCPACGVAPEDDAAQTTVLQQPTEQPLETQPPVEQPAQPQMPVEQPLEQPVQSQPPVEQPVQPQQQPFQPQTQQPYQAQMPYGQPIPQYQGMPTQPAKKSKTGLIIGIVVGVVVLIIVAIIVLAAAFGHAAKDFADDVVSDFENEYGEVQDDLEDAEIQGIDDYLNDTNLYTNQTAYMSFEGTDVYIGDDVFWISSETTSIVTGETDSDQTITSFDDVVPAGAEVELGISINDNPDQIIVVEAVNETGSEAAVNDCSIKLLSTYFNTANPDFTICGDIESTDSPETVIEKLTACGFVHDNDVINSANTASEMIGYCGEIVTEDNTKLIVAGADDNSVYAYQTDADGAGMIFIADFDYIMDM